MKELNLTGTDEQEYEIKVYRDIIIMAILIHSFYIIIFTYLSFQILSVYNICSTIFYFCILHIVQKKNFRLAVTVVHIEVCLFVITGTIAVGWEFGFYMYLIALSSLVYFCPFQHKYIPYLYSLGEICLFFILKFYISSFSPFYDTNNSKICLFIYVCNAASSFAIILFTAYLSNISAALGRKVLQDANHDLLEIANYDQLTNLMSRRYLLQKINFVKESEFVVVIGDIDDFKKVNDIYGHNCGDYVLHEIAGIMAHFFSQDTDICRWGGEEFVFLFHSGKLDNITKEVLQLCESIAQYPFYYESILLHITMTFGVCKREKGEDFKTALEHADESLYTGKSEGKNRVIVYK